MRHPEIGCKLLEGIAEALKGSAVIERTPMMEGRVMSMFVSRAPGWESPKKQASPSTVTSKRSEDSSTAHNGANTPTPVSTPESVNAISTPKEN